MSTGHAEKWSVWKTALVVFVVLLLGGPFVAAGITYIATGHGIESPAASGSADERRYHGRYAEAVDQCVSHIAGYQSSDNNREEFFRQFDPAAAVAQEVEPWSDDGQLRRHVRVAIPRIADGYFEGHYTRRAIGDEAVCYMFERRGVWNSSY